MTKSKSTSKKKAKASGPKKGSTSISEKLRKSSFDKKSKGATKFKAILQDKLDERLAIRKGAAKTAARDKVKKKKKTKGHHPSSKHHKKLAVIKKC